MTVDARTPPAARRPPADGQESGAGRARRFLRALYGDDAPGYIVLFTIPENDVHPVAADRPDVAGAMAERLARQTDVYAGVGLHGEPPKAGRRGATDGVVALPGFWMDLDLKAPYRDRDDLPAKVGAAMAFLDELPIRPTGVVHSGGGLYPWWVFKELWTFRSEDERTEAAHLSRGWQRFVIAAAEHRGWNLDLTADLARVLRLPGTVNRKGDEPRPVHILDASGPRCVPLDFDEWALPDPEPTRLSGGNTAPGEGLPEDVHDLLRAIPSSCHHDEWIRVGMALHHADPAEGFTAWNDWSATCPEKYPGVDELKRRWESFEADRSTIVTIGTLRHLACRYGHGTRRVSVAVAGDAR